MQNVVGEYMFFTHEDAMLAEKELDKVQRLNDKTDESNVELMLKIYNKCIENRTFKTPIGLDYMKILRTKLLSNEEIAKEVLPIPLFVNYDTEVRKHVETNNQRVLIEPKKTVTKDKYRIMLLTNLILVLVIIAMFIIASTSNHPNIINYENAIINKYASWEEELDQREQEIKQKESSFRD